MQFVNIYLLQWIKKVSQEFTLMMLNCWKKTKLKFYVVQM